MRMNPWRTGLQGLFRVEHRGQLFVFHADEPAGLFGDLLACRCDRGHLVACGADLAAFKHRMVAHQSDDVNLHIIGRDDGNDAGQLPCTSRVNGNYLRMGMRGPQYLAVEHPGQDHVVAVNTGTRDFLEGIDLGNTFSYNCERVLHDRTFRFFPLDAFLRRGFFIFFAAARRASTIFV